MSFAYAIIKQFKKYGIKIIPDLPRPATQFVKHVLPGKDFVVIEVGVREGKNALNMLEYLPIHTLYLLDINFSPTSKKLLEDERVVTIPGRSDMSLSTLKVEADFIYLDANKDFRNVLADLRLSYRLLKDYGVLGGHDINMQGNDIVKAVQTFVNEMNIRPRNIFFDDNDFFIVKEAEDE